MKRTGCQMRLPERLVSVANAITNMAILIGIPRPPYTRRNAIVVETVGRRSGRRRRVPVGYIEENGKLVVVVEDGSRAQWVQNALAQGGTLRVHFNGQWRAGHLRVTNDEPERYLARMNRVHAHLVRAHSTRPSVVEINIAE